jgi:hypothetical protein
VGTIKLKPKLKKNTERVEPNGNVGFFGFQLRFLILGTSVFGFGFGFQPPQHRTTEHWPANKTNEGPVSSVYAARNLHGSLWSVGPTICAAHITGHPRRPLQLA